MIVRAPSEPVHQHAQGHGGVDTPPGDHDVRAEIERLPDRQGAQVRIRRGDPVGQGPAGLHLANRLPAQCLQKRHGVVALDDFRSEHTPGVSIAAWEAVLNRGLNPVCLSTQKLYGTWGDPEPLQEALLEMAAGRDDCHLSNQRAAGHRVIRLKSRGMKAPDFPKSRHWAEPEPTPAGPTVTAVRSRPQPRPPL